MQADALKIPPQNIESEKALLGAIMLRPQTINDIVTSITPDTFYVDKHAKIFKAMLALFGKNEPIDLISLASKLKEQKIFESVGGSSYLTELVNAVPSSTNIKHYGEIVRKKHILRNLLAAADHIADLGYQEEKEIEHVLDEAEKKIFEVTSTGVRHQFVALKETLAEAWERLDRLHKAGDEMRGVPTGFPELDSKLAGLQKSDLIILAARPSVGKTSLALDIARLAATKHNIPVGIFSLEMSSQQLVDRMLAAESKVDAWKLRTGKLNADLEFTHLRDALDRLAHAPIYIDDQAGNNILNMRSVARRLKSEHGLGLIVVDYLQLMMPSTGSRSADSMVQQVTEISRSLKSLARELDVPVLALSQLNRAVEQRGGRPRLSDLRDSGSIEQDADVVMFIHRDRDENSEKQNVAEILIEKHRNGPTGKVELYFDDKKSTFLSIDKSGFGGSKALKSADDSFGDF